MRRSLGAFFALVCAGWLAACAAAPSSSVIGEPRDRTVHVVSNGWHTAIVVPRAELVATGLLPEAADFPRAAFLEFGWGDRRYYRARRATLGMTLRAALIPTEAVMHVTGRARAPERREGLEVIPVALTRTGLRSMARAIADMFERHEEGPAEALGPGLEADSRFYAARGRFHLFNTCNTWTARMLRAGSVRVAPAGVVTAGQVMARLRAALAGETRSDEPAGGGLTAGPRAGPSGRTGRAARRRASSRRRARLRGRSGASPRPRA